MQAVASERPQTALVQSPEGLSLATARMGDDQPRVTCSSYCGRSSVMVNHGAFEPTKM
jgi:hypothetical protein